MQGGRKNLLVFFILLIFCMPLCAETLEGSISIDSARSEAFEGIHKIISADEMVRYKSDRFYYSNMELIKEGKTYVDYGFERKIEPYYSKRGRLLAYSVQYMESSKKTFYYSKKDKLLKYEISNFENTYPYKTAAYNIRGKLLNINYFASENEQFIFNKKGKLIAYCLDDKCYNAKGKLISLKRYK